jgi:1,4-dihydroxy-2-naphthoate octaprenyltransferase
MNRETVKAWVQASRPPFYIATLVPILIGWILAKNTGWRLGRLCIVLAGSLIVHLATNLANDYFDHIKGTDSGASIGGSRVIQQGKIAPATLLKVIIALYGIALCIALYAIFRFDLFGTIPLVVLAWFSSLFYVAPPFRYGYHGLGELFVGINMGPVMVVGTYWVVTGSPAWGPSFISVPVGLMVASILYYQSLPDMETDAAVGKRTVAVRLGRRRAFIVLVAFWVAIYFSIILLSAVGLLSWLSLLSLLTIPLFAGMIRLVSRTAIWQELHGQGHYVRMLYFFCGVAIILGLL